MAPGAQSGGRGEGMGKGRYSVAKTTASGWAGRGDFLAGRRDSAGKASLLDGRGAVGLRQFPQE